MSLSKELFNDLRCFLEGEIRVDPVTRILYSTDASIYQIEPLGVIFPRSLDDINATVEIAAKYDTPILARGAGSSIAGQAIGSALIVDCSRYLNHIIQINPEEYTATVEPGVILNTLNHQTAIHNLTFGPDPATADRATLGGSIGNNATGAHSILYGMSVDHLLSADIVLSDGSQANFSIKSTNEALNLANNRSGIMSSLYGISLDIRENYSQTIRDHWPLVWRRASGYNLNYLLPWSPSSPPRWQASSDIILPYPPIEPNQINLATLFAGSESTLGIMRQLTVRLVPKLKNTILALLTYESIADACDIIPELLSLEPSAIELIPGDLIRLARSVPAYARMLTFFSGTPEAVLVIEFAGEFVDIQKSIQQLRAYQSPLKDDLIIAQTNEQQKQVWDVRKVGLGILGSLPGDIKPVGFIEDLAVPVERLGEFVREMQLIMAEYGTRANYYAHASAGCLHIRPLINLKDAKGVAAMRFIAEQAVSLTIRLGGAITGEHGDGIARSEWIEQSYGKEIVDLFRKVKQTADPKNILNPGKILDAPPMDTHLRYSANYQTHEWHTVLNYAKQGSLSGAIEMCNGAGVCRKIDGVMCPSFQVTQDENFSTRGRANLLRALISAERSSPISKLFSQAVYETLDLCLACKGCKSECPSTVDMAKLKYEFMDHYYSDSPFRHRIRDFLFGYIGIIAPLGAIVAPLLNWGLGLSFVKTLNDQWAGLSAHRSFPQFSTTKSRHLSRNNAQMPDCLLLIDTFSRYFHPETEDATIRVLSSAGLNVKVLPVIGAGRTLISKGFLKSARRHASMLLKAIRTIDEEGKIPVVGVEPSEILTLRDEFLDFFPNDEYVKSLAKRAWMIDEFLVRPGKNGKTHISQAISANPPIQTRTKKVLLHGHCYQKAQPPDEDGYPTGVNATVTMLKSAGYQVEIIESGCCGMAGAFGYESEHYEISMRVGEMILFPTVRKNGNEMIVAAAGTSCRSQIEDGTQKKAVHPIVLV